jgi:microcystin-dependent protein
VPLADATNVDRTGGGQPHENMQPFLTINYMIALTGQYPIRG